MIPLFSFRSLCFRSPSRRQQKASQVARPESLEVRSLMTISSVIASDAGEAVARIINGTTTADYPSVGKVGDNTGYYGSGTLIAPQYVLTAGHCAEGVADTNGRFFINGQEYKTTKVYLHPSYNVNQLGNDAANDIAIFKLDRAVSGVTPSPIYRSAPVVGQMLTLVGFGYGGNGNTGSDGIYGTKRVGTTPIDSVSSKIISWNFDNNTESNTAPGDSGGPAFVTVGGVRYVAGVTSGGDQENAAIGDHSFDTRVDAYAAWIDSIVGSVVAGPVVSIRASDAAAAETATGQTANPGQFVITRTGATTSALTVTLAVSGTATNGTDYNTLGTTVTIPAGAASATINLAVRDDALVEGSEGVTLTVVAGTGYSVDSASAAASVTIADNDAAKWNNLFADRQRLTGALVTVTGTNVNATRETGEPNIAGISGGKSVWYTWTAPVSGTVTLSTSGSAFDTTLGVYRGTAVNGLTQVAANDDENYNAGIYTSRVSFSAVAGQTYQIAVDGYGGESGAIRLTLDQPAGRRVSSSTKTKSAASSTNIGSASNDAQSVRIQQRQMAQVNRAAQRLRRRELPRAATTLASRSTASDIDAVFSDCVNSVLS